MKHQNGGIYYTPFTRGQSQSNASSVKQEESDGSNKIIEEMLSIAEENGLPIDNEYFNSQIENVLNKFNELGEYGESYGYSSLIKLHSLANRMKHNKELHTLAINNIAEENAGGEVAVSNSGMIYVYDNNNNDVKKVSGKEFKNNIDSYTILTNSQLAELRANSDKLKFDSSILTDLNEVVGMKSILEYVQGTVEKLGKETFGQTNELYHIKQGINEIIGNAPDGLYKVKEVLSKSYQGYDIYANPDEQTKQITDAINYLYRILPANMRHTLKAQAIGEGYDPETSSGAKSLLLMVLSNHTDHEIKTEKTLSAGKDLEGGSSGGGSGSGGGKRNISYLEEVANGKSAPHNTIVLGSSKDNGGIEAYAQSYPILNDELHQVNTNNLESMLNEAQIGKIVNKNSIIVGDQLVPYEQLNRVMWDGSTNAYRMYLPIDYNAKMTGIIKPDLNSYKKFQEFEKWVNDHPGIVAQQQYEKMKELGLNLKYDAETSSWKFADTELFIVTNGYVSDKVMDIESNEWFDKVPADVGSLILDQYETVVNFGTNTPNKNSPNIDNVDLGTWGLGWLGADGKRSFYKAPIFMHIEPSLATVVTENEYMNKADSEDLYNKREYNKEVRSIRTR